MTSAPSAKPVQDHGYLLQRHVPNSSIIHGSTNTDEF